MNLTLQRSPSANVGLSFLRAPNQEERRRSSRPTAGFTIAGTHPIVSENENLHQ
jgi:hypothetical protein